MFCELLVFVRYVAQCVAHPHAAFLPSALRPAFRSAARYSGYVFSSCLRARKARGASHLCVGLIGSVGSLPRAKLCTHIIHHRIHGINLWLLQLRAHDINYTAQRTCYRRWGREDIIRGYRIQKRQKT